MWLVCRRCAEHLAQIYNTRFNVFARPRHDGSHLTFPGLSKFLIPRPLQKDAVWFALQSQAVLVGDEVLCEMTPYDLTKARITYRFMPGRGGPGPQ